MTREQSLNTPAASIQIPWALQNKTEVLSFIRLDTERQRGRDARPIYAICIQSDGFEILLSLALLCASNLSWEEGKTQEKLPSKQITLLTNLCTHLLRKHRLCVLVLIRRYESFVVINRKLYVITNPRENCTALHCLHTESGTLRRGPCSEDRQTENLSGVQQSDPVQKWDDEQHRYSLVRRGWLSPWTVNKLRRVDFFFVCHGLPDPAVFLDVSWDPFLSTGSLKFLVHLQSIQAEPGAVPALGNPRSEAAATGPLLGETRRDAAVVSPTSWAPNDCASLEAGVIGASPVLSSKQDLKIRRREITVIAKYYFFFSP